KEILYNEEIGAAIAGGGGCPAMFDPARMLVLGIVLKRLPFFSGFSVLVGGAYGFCFEIDHALAQGRLAGALGALVGKFANPARAWRGGVVANFDNPSLGRADQSVIGVAVLEIDLRGSTFGAEFSDSVFMGGRGWGI